MKQSCNACSGQMFAVRFQSPTGTNTNKGAVTEAFATQFTRHCPIEEVNVPDDELVGPTGRGVVKYSIMAPRDPETMTVTGKWKAYLPSLDITLNLKSQGAVHGRQLRFVGVHSV